MLRTSWDEMSACFIYACIRHPMGANKDDTMVYFKAKFPIREWRMCRRGILGLDGLMLDSDAWIGRRWTRKTREDLTLDWIPGDFLYQSQRTPTRFYARQNDNWETLDARSRGYLTSWEGTFVSNWLRMPELHEWTFYKLSKSSIASLTELLQCFNKAWQKIRILCIRNMAASTTHAHLNYSLPLLHMSRTDECNWHIHLRRGLNPYFSKISNTSFDSIVSNRELSWSQYFRALNTSRWDSR